MFLYYNPHGQKEQKIIQQQGHSGSWTSGNQRSRSGKPSPKCTAIKTKNQLVGNWQQHYFWNWG